MDEEKDVQTEQNTKVPKNERKGFNITSMILGIVAVVCVCWWYISLPCAIIAIIFSIAGKNDAGRGMGIAGLVLGIVALALWVLLVLGIASLLGIAVSTY